MTARSEYHSRMMGPKFHLLALVGLTALAVASPHQTAEPKPRAANVLLLVDAASTETSLPVRLFNEGNYSTVNLVTPVTEIKAHYHAKHDETVYIVRGSGTMRIGEDTRDVSAGDLIHLPSGVVHSFVPRSKDCVAISVFGPKIDGTDRIFVGG